MQKRGCSICGSLSTKWEYRSAAVAVRLCRACGHREADHPAEQSPQSDYYEHTPTNEKFVASLLQTRKRQANAVLDRLLPLIDSSDGWLDFGCGRGPFLEEARRRGLTQVGGFETSTLSKQWLIDSGFPMAETKTGEKFWPDWKSLPFSPRVISLFDVLEHFPADEAQKAVQRMIAELPDLRWIVIKVPVSNGILFRLANLAKDVSPGIYQQLFQAGTFPPHFHYFSRSSLTTFLKSLGLRAAMKWDDTDLDNLFHRIPKLDFLPGGVFASLALKPFPGDTRTVFVKISR